MKKVLASGVIAVCLLILTSLPAEAASPVTFEYGEQVGYNNGQILWDGNKLILDVYPGEMPDGITFDLKGNTDKTITVRLMGDVQFPKIILQNRDSSSYSYFASIQFTSGDEQPHQVQVCELYGTGCDNDRLIIGSGIDMTINYTGLGGSGGSNSHLALEEDAKLTFESLEDTAGYWSSFNIKYIEIGKNAILINHSVLYDDSLPIKIDFASTSPSTAGKFVTEVDSANAAIISSADNITNLPQWLSNLIEQNGWQFDIHESLNSNGKPFWIKTETL